MNEQVEWTFDGWRTEWRRAHERILVCADGTFWRVGDTATTGQFVSLADAKAGNQCGSVIDALRRARTCLDSLAGIAAQVDGAIAQVDGAISRHIGDD